MFGAFSALFRGAFLVFFHVSSGRFHPGGRFHIFLPLPSRSCFLAFFGCVKGFFFPTLELLRVT